MNKLAIAVSAILLVGVGGVAQENNPKTYLVEEAPALTAKPLTKENKNYTKMQANLKFLKSRVNLTPYVFAGNTFRGWDCSGMVTWLYKGFGLALPHSADDLGHIGERVSKPVAGDIVVMAHTGRTDFYHTGIYLGNNKVINANRFYRTTVIESLDNYKGSQIRFVRVVPQQKLSWPSAPKTAENCWSNYKTENAAILNCEEKK